jgi:UPF0716 protein FxsA
VGLYFAKLQGIQTIRSALKNIYQNKTPINEIATGASIMLAALLLIIPGFFTDTIGFLLLIPFTRKTLINLIVKKKTMPKKEKEILDGEIIEDEKNEL